MGLQGEVQKRAERCSMCAARDPSYVCSGLPGKPCRRCLRDHQSCKSVGDGEEGKGKGKGKGKVAGSRIIPGRKVKGVKEKGKEENISEFQALSNVTFCFDGWVVTESFSVKPEDTSRTPLFFPAVTEAVLPNPTPPKTKAVPTSKSKAAVAPTTTRRSTSIEGSSRGAVVPAV